MNKKRNNLLFFLIALLIILSSTAVAWKSNHITMQQGDAGPDPVSDEGSGADFKVHANAICLMPNGSIWSVGCWGYQDYGECDIVVSESHDNGETWREPYTWLGSADYASDDGDDPDLASIMDPGFLRDGNDVYFFYVVKSQSHNSNGDAAYTYMIRSNDSGATWSDRVNMSEIYNTSRYESSYVLLSPGGFTTSNGTLIQPFWGVEDWDTINKRSTGCYRSYPGSDRTDISGWHLADGYIYPSGDSNQASETQMVLLPNDTILAYYRTVTSDSTPDVAISTDYGDSWSGYNNWVYGGYAETRNALRYFSSNYTYGRYTSGSEILHDKDRLYYIYCDSNSREDTSIVLSYDNGTSWTSEKEISSAGGYSDAIVTDNGTFVVQYSYAGGYNQLYVSRFDLGWVTDGADEYISRDEEGIQFISINDYSNGTTIYDSKPTINWTVESNTSQYWLQISTEQDFSNVILNYTDINQYTYPINCDINTTRVSFTIPDELSSYGIYYMRVKSLSR